jgi:outer membrane lipoprotein-sorting protein
MQTTRIAFMTAFVAAPVLCVAGPAQAQDAREILNRAVERYEERTRGIESYTIVQTSLGTEITTDYEKRVIDGRTVFVPTDMDERATGSDVAANFSKMAESAVLEGRETIDGNSTFVIRVTDLESIGMTEAMAANADGFEARSMVMYLDTEMYMPRRMVIEGVARVNGQDSPITSTVDLTDYRTVDGVLHPFLTTLTTEGVAGMSEGMSEEDIANARQQLAEFDKQLAEMPESQRAMMERMMGDRINALREMLESGNMEIKVEVKEIRVNKGFLD